MNLLALLANTSTMWFIRASICLLVRQQIAARDHLKLAVDVINIIMIVLHSGRTLDTSLVGGSIHLSIMSP